LIIFSSSFHSFERNFGEKIHFQKNIFLKKMDVLQLESFFGKSSFAFLFLSMIFSWIQVVFAFDKRRIGRIFMGAANFSLFFLLIFRWVESGHFPLSNLYESLMFLSWSFSTFHLLLENFEFSETKLFDLNIFPEKKNSSKNSSAFFGAFTSPPALFTNAFATFSLPEEMQHSSSLVPALQSNWLMMHVTVMILSYSALICGSLLAIAYLIFTQNQPQSEDQIVLSAASEQKAQKAEDQLSLAFSANQPNIQFPLSEQLPQKTQEESGSFSRMSLKEELSEKLDNLSYRLLGIGFPFLTIGILSGAVWANEAWGSYWSWDPKETWALATWLVFAMYLHTRLTKGWKGRKSAFLAAFGFIIVWVCFLGVNLLGEGLHSYGFFQK
jgi:cytochrome c-type biogenesis protein CcsB